MPALPPAVEDAIAALRAHPQVVQVETIEILDGMVRVVAEFDSNLPSRWQAEGVTPEGVRARELIEIWFSKNYPDTAPYFSLRPDFNRALPHINPHAAGERVPPCLFAGSTLELLHSEGFFSVVNQMALWLERAGRMALIDHSQGWEPMRRDAVQSILNIDTADDLEAAPLGQIKLYLLKCIWSGKDRHACGYQRKTCSSNVLTTRRLQDLQKDCLKVSDDEFFGQSLLAVCWPNSNACGRPDVVHVYQPDTVQTIADLSGLADEVHCNKAFDQFLSNLRSVSKSVRDGFPPIFVVFPVPRPVPVIGTGSDTEYLAYQIDVPAGGLGDSAAVSAAVIRSPVSDRLLRRMSGLSETVEAPKTAFLGCGSVGSKLAMHMTRAGFPPSMLIDFERFEAHNVARHALLGDHVGMRKAKALAYEIGKLASTAPRVITTNFMNPTTFENSNVQSVLSSNANFLVNTTAAHSVRSFLAHAPISTRVIEACLMNRGRIGLLTVEGLSRNPTSTDLMAAAYEELRDLGCLAPLLDQEDAELGIGIGCNSVTLPMSDARISHFCGAIGESLLDAHVRPIPSTGRVSVGRVLDDGMSIVWGHLHLGETQVADATGLDGWSVRILESAHRRICEDINRFPGVETGGLIVGRCSAVAREVVITDILPAPEDSQRNPDRFVLGTRQLAATISTYNESAANVLWCVGTWHSHLVDPRPSPTDHATALSIEGLLKSAVIVLIKHPTGYSAIVRRGRLV